MNFHGLFLVDKPKDWSSHDVVAWMRKKIKTSAIGHCGTLDPMATGLMVLLVGEATKLSSYILEQNKSYLAQIKIGIETDTWDITGTILKETPIKVPIDFIRQQIENMQGESYYEVPSYSAIKVNGEKLYQYARRGEKLQVPPRLMNFIKVDWVLGDEQEFQVKMDCSKGSYVRSWAHTLGQNLKCGATLTGLRRLKSEPFDLKQAVTLDEISLSIENSLLKSGIPLSEALPQWKEITVIGRDEAFMRQGQISNDLRAKLITRINPLIESTIKIVAHSTHQLIALVVYDPQKGIFVRRVFRYDE